jgi:hypothetical protein
VASAKGMSTGYRGKRMTKDRLAGMSSYEKAKKSSAGKIVKSAPKKTQKTVNRMGSEGPKKRGK